MTLTEHVVYIKSLYDLLLKNSGHITRRMATERLEKKCNIIVSRQQFGRYIDIIRYVYDVEIIFDSRTNAYSIEPIKYK